MKAIKRTFVKPDETVHFDTNTRIIERYWDYTANKSQKNIIGIDFSSDSPKKICLSFIYLDLSKPYQPTEVLEYVLSEEINIEDGKRKKFDFTTQLDDRHLWKIKFEILSNERNPQVRYLF